ncbi:unnamed protein product, partial [Ectocarpus fasciculatus]
GNQPFTRLFCADCGECFHRWCLPSNIVPLDKKALAAWRCPNCKVCEVCTETAKSDESLLLMCELCDRAYHTYCLTPSTDKPPEGTWICGQCISCTTCSVPQVRCSFGSGPVCC